MNKNFSSTLAGSALLVAAAAILSRGTGFLREIVFAGYFGTDRKFDIYLTATVIPFIINTSIYYIAQNYLIPVYYSRSNKESEQKNVINESFKLFILLALIVTLVLFLLRSIIVDYYLWNSSANIKWLAVKVYTITTLTIPFNAGYSVLAAYYQAKLKFKYPAILPVIQNLLIILIVILGNRTFGIYSIPIGYLAGCLFQFLILIFLYEDKRNLFTNLRFSKTVLSQNKLFTIIIIVEILSQLYLFIDRYFFNFVETGGIAALNYSSVLFNLPVTITSFSLATVYFPKFSELAEQEKIETLNKYFYRILFITFIFFIPVTVVYYFYGTEIIKIVFQRGSFTFQDTTAAFKALKMYTISLVFFSSFSIIYKMMFSLGLSRLLLLFTFFVFVLKIFFNFLFVGQLGFSGLALASSISYIIITVLCYISIIKKMKAKGEKINTPFVVS